MTNQVNYTGDVVIIGGGIVGTALANQLAKYKLRVFLLEKEADLAAGTSKANSGIVHAPYKVDPNTLKGKLLIRSVPMVPELAEKLHVPYKNPGALIVAYNEKEAEKVRAMYQRTQDLNLEGMELVERDRLLEIEPELNPNAQLALLAKTAGTISPYEFTFALAENAVLNGVEVHRNTQVVDLQDQEEDIKVVTQKNVTYNAKVVINAAGLFADEVQKMVGDNDFTITPRKGEYFLFDKNYGHWAKHVLFPVPSKVSKGILVIPTVDGNLLVGPTAEEQDRKINQGTSADGLGEVLAGGEQTIPRLAQGQVINQFAGLRAVIKETEDFYIQPSKHCPGLIHVAGIQSPGLTAAPAIAEYVVEMLTDLDWIPLEEDDSYGYRRRPPLRFNELSRSEQAELIAKDPRYGHIICRCEHVTEAEIIEAITGPLGARTMGGVKRRARAGMGRCQGGFCGPKILELIAQYGQISKLEVTKEGGDSVILQGQTKGEVK